MRFRARHLQQTIVDHLALRLGEAGWISEPVNFDLEPLKLVEDVTVEDEPDLEPQTLAVTLEDEGPDELQQLGGGLWAVDFSLFLDCYGVNGVMAGRVLQDCKRFLLDLYLPVMDYSGETPVQSGEFAEFEVLGIERPGRATSSARSMEARRRWRLLTAMVTVTFHEDEDEEQE